MTKRLRPDQFPPWYDGQSINEAAFCREFLASHKLLYTENSFFTPEGRMTDVAPLKTEGNPAQRKNNQKDEKGV